MPAPQCPCCQQSFDLEPFVRGVTGYSLATNSGGGPCPRCQETLEFRVSSSALEIGFTYWGARCTSTRSACIASGGCVSSSRALPLRRCWTVSSSRSPAPLGPPEPEGALNGRPSQGTA
jgi:hypothetical protein